jgi:hypothetical protein
VNFLTEFLKVKKHNFQMDKKVCYRNFSYRVVVWDLFTSDLWLCIEWTPPSPMSSCRSKCIQINNLKRRVLSSEMWRRWKETNVTEELVASIFSVEPNKKLVWRKQIWLRNSSILKMEVMCSPETLVSFTRLQSSTELFIATAMRIIKSNSLRA